MSNMRAFGNLDLLAKAAARQAVRILGRAIEANGSAVWVLSGGSTPLAAYEVLTSDFIDELDWSKVTVIIGDERIGALDSPNNNWHAAMQALGSLPLQKLRPFSDQSAENAASNYSLQLASLPKLDNGLPRLDLVWLGIGADGHTLSIFPGHTSLQPATDLVIPVHDAPKPPADRISLSLRALQGAHTATFLATGEDKKAAVAAARDGGQSPAGLAVTIVETHEGIVHWLVDAEATP